jgi:hypothetical protein
MRVSTIKIRFHSRILIVYIKEIFLSMVRRRTPAILSLEIFQAEKHEK